MNIKTVVVGKLLNNTYIITTKENNAVIIDPGIEFDKIEKALLDTGASLKYIIFTHGHYDHTGAAEELSAAWPGVPVYLNRRDGGGSDPYMNHLFPAVPGAKDYDEGDEITVGSLTVRVLATPGHSEGSVTLRCGDVLFCGDTLFAGSCGRTDFPGGSMQTILKSLKRLGELEGDYQVCPGHMSTSEMSRERMSNPYLMQALK